MMYDTYLNVDGVERRFSFMVSKNEKAAIFQGIITQNFLLETALNNTINSLRGEGHKEIKIVKQVSWS